MRRVMADLDSAPILRPNLAEYTVGEISHAIRRTLETDFTQVRVRGDDPDVLSSIAGKHRACSTLNASTLAATRT